MNPQTFRYFDRISFGNVKVWDWIYYMSLRPSSFLHISLGIHKYHVCDKNIDIFTEMQNSYYVIDNFKVCNSFSTK